MILKELSLAGVFEIQLKALEDPRGFFMRTYDDQIFRDHGLPTNWVQENHSLNIDKWTVRGLHFQFPPYTEGKLIRVIRGEVFDVFVDIRQNSPSFGKWGSVILSEAKKSMLFIPRGFAHGYCTLKENCELEYKMDNYYSPKYASIIFWNDPLLAIKWPLSHLPIISERDSQAQRLQEFIDLYGGLEV